MKLEFIDKDTYKKLGCDSVFDESHNDSYRRFGKLAEADSCAKIAWSSDLLIPQFIMISKYIYAIGIDQNFTIYDFDKKCRIMDLDLMYFFDEMVKFKEYLFIATELEIIIVDIQEYKILDTIFLPDIYKKINIFCNKIDIYCLDNSVISYQIGGN